jgi:hypothetical protein
MPFGLRNSPGVLMVRRTCIEIRQSNGTTIIIDNTMPRPCPSLSMESEEIPMDATINQVCRSGFPCSSGGNTPAQSKDIILSNWKTHSTPKHVSGFTGLAIFYL